MARFTRYHSSRAFLEPTEETFRALEEAIEWAEVYVPSRLRAAMNELTFHMALLNQGFAREMSFGPYDPGAARTEFHQLTGHQTTGLGGFSKQGPQYQSSPAAWQIPVRRITGRYYLGWKIKSLGPAVWQLYNDSREAYYIEFGISPYLHRVRRPIRKLSLKKTMDFMMRTEAWDRIWVSIYADPKYIGGGMGFSQTVHGAGAAVTGNLRGALVRFGGPSMQFGQTQKVTRAN